MAQTSIPDAAAPAARDRSGRLLLAAAACTTLYLASTVSAYLLSELGGRRTLPGALAGMAAIAALSLVIVRLSSRLAYPVGRHTRGDRRPGPLAAGWIGGDRADRASCF